MKTSAPNQYLNEYLVEVNKHYQSGRAGEHAYRGDFASLIKGLAPDVQVTNEPKDQTFGRPDLILNRKGVPVGFIETKDIGKDLNSNTYTKQFDKYKEAQDNFIFTDYLEFHFYRGEKLTATIAIAKVVGGKIKSMPKNFKNFEVLFRDFCDHVGQTIKSPKELAEKMADKAILLKVALNEALTSDEKTEEDTELRRQYGDFKKVLIKSLTPSEFADIYAQTLAYGMFSARWYDSTLDSFSRREAAELIPKSNPFLRKLFDHVGGIDIDERIETQVDDLANVFRATDIRELLKDFGKATQTQDPIVHFYENFLHAYNPKTKKDKGVYYTPGPVVDFITRGVDDILKTEFGLKDGLADTSKVTIEVKSEGTTTTKEVHKVQVLDPATGTGTFLASVIKLIHQRKSKSMKGAWSGYVEKHLIPRLNGFELMMAPYAIAHLKMDMMLRGTVQRRASSSAEPTYITPSNNNQRFNIFLTDSLEHPNTDALFSEWLLLSKEAEEANRVKSETPVMVVMGNPPYLGESTNNGDWIMDLMEDYKKEPGGKEKLKEKNPKAINDDYVKFIRYGQHFIEKNGSGVLAYICPHGFLDNLTFRGMRWKLLETYDKIYTIDLHGNIKKKKACPDDSKDENVFNIQQGVAITFFIKTGKKKENELAHVFHHELCGTRESKYQFLTDNSLSSTPYKKLPNVAPKYFMVSKDFEGLEEYMKGFSVEELFVESNVGIVTARDKFTIHDSKEEVKKTIETFLSLEDEEARTKFNLGKDSRDWKVNFAKKDLNTHYPNKGKFTKISYYPFDTRWTYYTGKSRGFHCTPRGDVMKHFLKGDNFGLVFKRGNAEENSASIMVTKNIIDFRSWSRPGMQGGDYVAPLYLYPKNSNQLEIGGIAKTPPNLKQEIVDEIAEKLGLTFTKEKNSPSGGGEFSPLDILDYIYAVLHSPAYRVKYKEFLKIDFPRVPYPKDKDTFWELVKLGGEIRQLHLLESSDLENSTVAYPHEGSDIVEPKIVKKGWELYEGGKLVRIWINDQQCFENIPLSAWEFYIGGYQPAQLWLKKRPRCKLGYDDIEHYQKIIVALTETGRIMSEIDRVYISA